ncbi:hypothetical protein RvY_02642-2 [Ramazzottius varieornatus]|uniref:P-type domain-containing protein n=1 Tax=Ramazzottius varieornatus TaxID=947166 RepID=A0A1D1UKF7_RAMVA|nr:hypothetical protein RvY_02642-2 [Ramazzottius varieornatus]
MHITSSRVASRMSFRVPPANLALLLVIINCLPLISSNKPEGSSANEVTHKGSALKEMFNTFQLPTEFLEIEKIKKVRTTSLLAASLRNNTRSSQPSAIREEIVVKACTPDALPWLGPKGYCVPTNLLLTFCGEYESSASSDCPQTEGNWCCYKPTPAAPSIMSPYSRPTYLDVKPCTPDLYPWMGPKGFCSATDQLNEYCSTLEISASNRDCPGRENWCCYSKPAPTVYSRQEILYSSLW